MANIADNLNPLSAVQQDLVKYVGSEKPGKC